MDYLPTDLQHAREVIDPLKALHLLGSLDGDAHVSPVEVPGLFLGNFAHPESAGHLADGLVTTIRQADGYLRSAVRKSGR